MEYDDNTQGMPVKNYKFPEKHIQQLNPIVIFKLRLKLKDNWD